MNNLCLTKEESVIFALRSLYQKYGYLPYKMSKFEEYDLYLKNKNFLVSENIITFTDTDGKLLALKPDVTLSIIKNMDYDLCPIHKVYYDENVYRTNNGTNTFKEIMQTGLECIGNIDNYTIYETLLLAAKSLSLISDDYIVDISHIGIIADILDKQNITDNRKKQIINCIERKNISEISQIEKQDKTDLSLIKKLITSYGTSDEVMPFLENLDSCYKDDFISIINALEKDGLKGKIRIDFSITGDISYYNGFVFKGFINGIPSSVLSGGQYDNLMAKFGRPEKAIGFAVYIDMIERLPSENDNFDVDTVLLYDENTGMTAITEAVRQLTDCGASVSVQTEKPTKIRYKQLARLTEKGLEILENNA